MYIHAAFPDPRQGQRDQSYYKLDKKAGAGYAEFRGILQKIIVGVLGPALSGGYFPVDHLRQRISGIKIRERARPVADERTRRGHVGGALPDKNSLPGGFVLPGFQAAVFYDIYLEKRISVVVSKRDSPNALRFARRSPSLPTFFRRGS